VVLFFRWERWKRWKRFERLEIWERLMRGIVILTEQSEWKEERLGV